MTFEEVLSSQKTYIGKYKKVRNIVCAIFLPIFVFGTIFIFSNKGDTMAVFPIVLFLAVFSLVSSLLIIHFSTRKELKEFKKNYKGFFVGGSFEKVFSEVSYNHEGALSSEVVSKVMTKGDRYHSNDLTVAKYKNIGFTQADVHTEKRVVDDEGHVDYETIFKGRFLIFDFDRNFASNLQLRSRWFRGAVLPKNETDSRKFEKIETESGEFNRSFSVFGQDGNDAFYILDPAFMEKVLELYRNCKRELLLTFMDKKVFIAINDGKDSFEIKNPRKLLDEAEEMKKVQQDILVITNFVDSLDLDRYFKGGQA